MRIYSTTATNSSSNPQRDAINAIPTAQQYYLSRSALIQAVTPGFDIDLLLNPRTDVREQAGKKGHALFPKNNVECSPVCY
jgi:hypothetical protein